MDEHRARIDVIENRFDSEVNFPLTGIRLYVYFGSFCFNCSYFLLRCVCVCQSKLAGYLPPEKSGLLGTSFRKFCYINSSTVCMIILFKVHSSINCLMII